MPDKPPGQLNCGQCEKCVRTMTTLVALGKLDKTNAFPETDVSKKLLVTRGHIRNTGIKAIYNELIPLLEATGRFDLIDGIRCLTAQYNEQDWKGWLKRFDRWFLNGQLIRYFQKIK